ncbi:hypothetical protein CEP51_000938 [Fusarium floridanum]|uniref:C2H2-type domain-containing protein n=1 Tax=Fusarium floridanum TaxID=1325733 RepID=A0A428SJV3_9HYPO|nr:hypothetical protein CEP51_000938 [Fusarium floridanum]
MTTTSAEELTTDRQHDVMSIDAQSSRDSSGLFCNAVENLREALVLIAIAMPSHTIRPRGRLRQCAYCDRVFTKEEHLRRHQRAHTGEKPFKCRTCGKSYARSDVLFRHLQTHSIMGADINHRYSEASKGERPRDYIRRKSLDATVEECDSSTGSKEISIPTPERRSRATIGTRILRNDQRPSQAQSLPSAVPSSTLAPFHPQSPSQTMADPDTDTMMPSAESQIPDVSLEDSLGGVVFEDGDIMQLVPDLIPHGMAGSEASAESSNDRCAPDPLQLLHVDKPKSPRQHMIQSQATRSIQDVESDQRESQLDHLPFEISQMLESQLDIELEL